MEDEDRRRLQTTRSFLVKNIENVEDITEELFSQDVFTEGMKNDVEVQETKDKKVRKLLDILPRRGPNAFGIFLDILKCTKNEHIYDRLVSGYSKATNKGSILSQPVHEEESDLPQIWPDQRSILEASQTIIKPFNPELDKHIQSGRAYKMIRNPRGRVVIINNKIFSGPVQMVDGKNRVMLSMRDGTDEDSDGLKKLFEDLHFHVKIHKDKNAQKIREILLAESNDIQFHRHAECFILVILTHGTQNAIYGSDGKTVDIKELKDLFNARNFTCMATKPKLFFIQACRGEDYDKKVKIVSADSKMEQSDAGPIIDLELLRKRMDNIVINGANDTDAMVERTIPADSHRLVAMATTMDMVSFRNQILGSWFIQAVIYIFRKRAHCDDLLTMLSEVNHLVSLGKAKDRLNQDAVAVSEFESTLSKRFYFFPQRCETIPFQASSS